MKTDSTIKQRCSSQPESLRQNWWLWLWETALISSLKVQKYFDNSWVEQELALHHTGDDKSRVHYYLSTVWRKDCHPIPQCLCSSDAASKVLISKGSKCYCTDLGFTQVEYGPTTRPLLFRPDVIHLKQENGNRSYQIARKIFKT